mmetsp:Transcript_13718/g.51158  ORF Transcript_13718/g.51158 Transcript_13718/m.51158 type:complete len:274 (+) Transcript_13718:700-1521(+)
MLALHLLFRHLLRDEQLSVEMAGAELLLRRPRVEDDRTRQSLSLPRSLLPVRSTSQHERRILVDERVLEGLPPALLVREERNDRLHLHIPGARIPGRLSRLPEARLDVLRPVDQLRGLFLLRLLLLKLAQVFRVLKGLLHTVGVGPELVRILVQVVVRVRALDQPAHVAARGHRRLALGVRHDPVVLRRQRATAGGVGHGVDEVHPQAQVAIGMQIPFVAALQRGGPVGHKLPQIQLFLLQIRAAGRRRQRVAEHESTCEVRKQLPAPTLLLS